MNNIGFVFFNIQIFNQARPKNALHAFWNFLHVLIIQKNLRLLNDCKFKILWFAVYALLYRALRLVRNLIFGMNIVGKMDIDKVRELF